MMDDWRMPVRTQPTIEPEPTGGMGQEATSVGLGFFVETIDPMGRLYVAKWRNRRRVRPCEMDDENYLGIK